MHNVSFSVLWRRTLEMICITFKVIRRGLTNLVIPPPPRLCGIWINPIVHLT